MEEVLGPERPGGQGLDRHQEESGNRAILALLHDPEVRDHVDLVITHRDGAYEVWAARGMVRFQRVLRDGQLTFRVVEQIGDNPIADQQHDAIATCAEELHAAAASGHPTEDVNHAFIEPEQRQLPVRLRTHRAALRQPVRARHRDQPEVLRLRPAARPARRPGRRAVARAAGVRRPRHPCRASTTARRATSTSRRRSAT